MNQLGLDRNGCPLPPPPAPPISPISPASLISPPAKVPDPRVVIRVAPDAMGWVHGLAEHCSLSVTDLVWQSLMRQADASAYHHKTPPRFVSAKPGRRRQYPRPRYD